MTGSMKESTIDLLSKNDSSLASEDGSTSECGEERSWKAIDIKPKLPYLISYLSLMIS
jgi:hypothetical protein